MLQALLWAKEYNKAKKIPHGIYKTLLKFFQIDPLVFYFILSNFQLYIFIFLCENFLNFLIKIIYFIDYFDNYVQYARLFLILHFSL